MEEVFNKYISLFENFEKEELFSPLFIVCVLLFFFFFIRGIPLSKRSIGQKASPQYEKPFGDNLENKLDHDPKQENRKEVIIIGGGAAGLSIGACLGVEVEETFFTTKNLNNL